MHFIRWVLALGLVTVSHNSLAKEAAIFDSRKPVALSKNQETYIDFYINAGLEAGLRRGVLVSVVRSTSLYDAYQNKSPDDLIVPVGQLKIIHAQKGLSVGRIHQVFNRENLPILDYDSIMVGDRLDLSTVVSATKVKKSPEVKTAPAETPSVGSQPVEKPQNSVDFASSLPEKAPIVLPQLQ